MAVLNTLAPEDWPSELFNPVVKLDVSAVVILLVVLASKFEDVTMLVLILIVVLEAKFDICHEIIICRVIKTRARTRSSEIQKSSYSFG